MKVETILKLLNETYGLHKKEHCFENYLVRNRTSYFHDYNNLVHTQKLNFGQEMQITTCVYMNLFLL